MPMVDAFILTRQWRDSPKGLVYELWVASKEGPIRIVVDGGEAVCFVNRGNSGDRGIREFWGHNT